MMRSTWLAATVALVGLVGCGGGGGDDGKRTYMACGTADACMVMQADAPADMSCTAPELPSCSTEGVLATCEIDQFVLHLTLYVYSPDALVEAQQECTSQGGAWTVTSAP